MNVKDCIERLSLETFHPADLQREVKGGYCGDLLSWVMGRVPTDGAWITIMSNVNVAAVAVLGEVACVILTEGVCPDEALLEKCKVQQVNLLGCGNSTFAVAAALSKELEQ